MAVLILATGSRTNARAAKPTPGWKVKLEEVAKPKVDSAFKVPRSIVCGLKVVSTGVPEAATSIL